MDGKRNTCMTCRWSRADTEVCVNDQSEHCADFVNLMEDCCDQYEMWPGLRFDLDKPFSSEPGMTEQREKEDSEKEGSRKKKASYNKNSKG